MAFKRLMQDRVSLIKKDGQRFDDIQSSVQRDKIFSNDPSIPIEESDIFERILPSGIAERYEVIDAGYYEGRGGIKAHYQSVVRKLTKVKQTDQPSPVIFNLTGPNARVNIHSTDKSTNLVEIESKELFSKLRDVIEKAIPDESVLVSLTEKVDELEKTQGTNKFVMHYREFLALATDHIAILAPFLPALEQLLR